MNKRVSEILMTTALVAVTVFLFSVPLFAQTGAGTIQGTVTDANGAVVVGAKVEITRTATTVTRTTVTNDAGFYTVPSLTIGNYKVSVEASGMKRWEGNLVLQAGQTAVIDASMELSSVAGEVTVVGDVTQTITTDAPTISNVIDRQRIEQLPQNGRGLLTLINRTTPGIEGESIQNRGNRINGLRDESLEFVQDGAVLANRDFGGLNSRPPGLDSIQELRLETNGSSAKFSRPATAIITTKSGTNGFHGSAFITNRNNSYGFARSRTDLGNAIVPFLNRNEFGGSIGGPIYLPRFGEGTPYLYNGKNRSFFFAAWEGLEQRENTTARFTVPTLAMRNGDFSGLINGNGERITIYDPLTTRAVVQNGRTIWTRNPFPGNQIPLSRFSPFARTFLSYIPLPTNDLNPLITQNWVGSVPNSNSEKTFTARLDHRFSGNDNVFFRFSYGTRSRQYLNTNNYGPPTSDPDRSGNVTYDGASTYSGSLSWTHVFSPTFFSETVLAHTYEGTRFGSGLADPRNFADEFGLPNNFGDTGFPWIQGLGSASYNQSAPRRNYQNVTNLDQNFTMVRGNHELYFGGRYRREHFPILPEKDPPSVVASFSSLATSLFDPLQSTATYNAQRLTGNDFANYLLGVANSYQIVLRQGVYDFSDREYAMYLQDNYKVTPRLTLNLGLRWEIHPALKEKNNFLTGFDTETKSIVTGRPLEDLYQLGVTTPAVIRNYTNIGVKFTTADAVGRPAGLINPSYYDFGPRLGFAYKLFGDQRPTVIRGGYGLYTFMPPVRNYYAESRFNPPFSAFFVRSYNSSTQSPDGLPNYLLRSIPTIIAGQNSTNAIDLNSPSAITRGDVRIEAFSEDYPSTKAHQWNLTVEREIFKNISIRASYVANHATNLEQQNSLNSPVPDYVWYTTRRIPFPTGTFANTARRPFENQTYGTIDIATKTGWSNSNAFQFEVNKRFADGYGFQFFYGLSNNFKAGGDGWRDDGISPYESYIEGTVPRDFEERNRFLNYRRDTATPKHRFRWNWIADIPLGKDKWLFGKSNKFVNAVIGGWQFAGLGTYRSQYWQLGTGSWNLNNAPLEIYGKKYKIQTCNSGQCRDGYLWYNGYIPPSQRNQLNASGTGILGLPDNYVPAHTPLIQEPGPGETLCGQPIRNFWNSNTVPIVLNNGNCVTTGFSPGPHPYSKTYFLGPWNWVLDASLFKTFSVTESVKLRINIDAFNVLNNPGINSPSGTSGILSTESNFNAPRRLQLTGRITW